MINHLLGDNLINLAWLAIALGTVGVTLLVSLFRQQYRELKKKDIRGTRLALPVITHTLSLLFGLTLAYYTYRILNFGIIFNTTSISWLVVGTAIFLTGAGFFIIYKNGGEPEGF